MFALQIKVKVLELKSSSPVFNNLPADVEICLLSVRDPFIRIMSVCLSESHQQTTHDDSGDSLGPEPSHNTHASQHNSSSEQIVTVVVWLQPMPQRVQFLLESWLKAFKLF